MARLPTEFVMPGAVLQIDSSSGNRSSSRWKPSSSRVINRRMSSSIGTSQSAPSDYSSGLEVARPCIWQRNDWETLRGRGLWTGVETEAVELFTAVGFEKFHALGRDDERRA